MQADSQLMHRFIGVVNLYKIHDSVPKACLVLLRPPFTRVPPAGDASNQRYFFVCGTRLSQWPLYGCGCGLPKGDTCLLTTYTDTRPGTHPKGC